MKVQGRDCTLTVAKDNEYYPLPYSEETVRQTSKGYSLPGVIGIRNREKRIITGRSIEGCFVTRLEYQNLPPLFLLLFNSAESFDPWYVNSALADTCFDMAFFTWRQKME